MTEDGDLKSEIFERADAVKLPVKVENEKKYFVSTTRTIGFYSKKNFLTKEEILDEVSIMIDGVTDLFNLKIDLACNLGRQIMKIEGESVIKKKEE